MRPAAHEVKLQGGTLVVPLTFATFRALCAVALDPRDPPDQALGFADPAQVVSDFARKGKDPHTMVALRLLHVAAGAKSPGVEALSGMDTQRALVTAAVEVCARIALSMAPAKEEDAPKA